MKRSVVSMVMVCGATLAAACAERPEDPQSDNSSSSSGGSGSSSGDAAGTSSSSSSGASGSSSGGSSGTVVDTGFRTDHEYVGCDEIGPGEGGQVLLAGHRKAAIFTAQGALVPSFGSSGILTPVPCEGGSCGSGFIQITLDGKGEGFYGLEVGGVTSSYGALHRFAMDGAPTRISTEVNWMRMAAVDSNGDAYLIQSYIRGDGGALVRVSPSGEMTTLLSSVGGPAKPLTPEIGPFLRFHAVAHYGSAHYVLGTESDESEQRDNTIRQIDDTGEVVSSFQRVRVGGDEENPGVRLRIGPDSLVIISENQAVIRDRNTGEMRHTISFVDRAFDAAVDENNRLYVTSGASRILRYLPTGELDSTFTPIDLGQPPDVGERSIVLGLAQGRLLVSRCIQADVNTQTTYAFPR